MSRCLEVASLVLFAFAGLSAQAAVDCKNAYTFAQQTICSSEQFKAADKALDSYIEEVREHFAEGGGFASEPLRFARKMVAERSFCMTRDCIYDWLDNSLYMWNEFRLQARKGYGRVFLDNRLKEEQFVLDVTSPRPEQTIEGFSKICRSATPASSAGCFMAALEGGSRSIGYLDAACSRQRGAVSGLACALLATYYELGVSGRKPDREFIGNLLRKACTLESPTACLTLGDYYLLGGEDNKAYAAYNKGSMLGANSARASEMLDNRAQLVAAVRSSPSPAEREAYRKCIAPYKPSAETYQCALNIGEGRDKRLARVLDQFDVPAENRKAVEKAAKKRYTTLSILLGLRRLATYETRTRAELIAADSVNRVTYLLSLLAQKSVKDLSGIWMGMCPDENCRMIDTEKQMLKDKVDAYKDFFSRQFSNQALGMEMVNSLVWAERINRELADTVAEKLGSYEGADIVQAILLYEILEFCELTQKSLDIVSRR